MAALRRGGPQSRTELTAATGLSNSTVTLITGALIDEGSIVEADGAGGAARRGRPQQSLSLNPLAASVGVVTLTLNRLSASIIDYAGQAEPERTLRLETTAATTNGLREAMLSLLREAVLGGGGRRAPLRHIAVAVQGITDAAGAELLWSPVTPLRHVPIARWLEGEFGVSTTVANDCNMIAEALRWSEPAIYADNFAALLLSHGIGMGLYVKGQPFTGISSSAAEFGHMCFDPHGAACRCGRAGCIEAYAGDYGIWRNATGASPDAVPNRDFDRTTMADLVAAARAAPGREREAYRKAGEALGSGLRSLFALFDPFPVALVGSGALAWDLLEPGLRLAIGTGQTEGPQELSVHCYENEFPLIRDGALMTALMRIDSDLSGLGAPEHGRLFDAV